MLIIGIISRDRKGERRISSTNRALPALVAFTRSWTNRFFSNRRIAIRNKPSGIQPFSAASINLLTIKQLESEIGQVKLHLHTAYRSLTKTCFAVAKVVTPHAQKSIRHT